MAKAPTAKTIAAELTVPERVLLFCLASDTDWVTAGATHSIAQGLLVRVSESGDVAHLPDWGASPPWFQLAALGVGPDATLPRGWGLRRAQPR
jgi:hypothetical protein